MSQRPKCLERKEALGHCTVEHRSLVVRKVPELYKTSSHIYPSGLHGLFVLVLRLRVCARMSCARTGAGLLAHASPLLASLGEDVPAGETDLSCKA